MKIESITRKILQSDNDRREEDNHEEIDNEDSSTADERSDYSTKKTQEKEDSLQENEYSLIWFDPQIDSREKNELRNSLQKIKTVHYFSQLNDALQFAGFLKKSFLVIAPTEYDEQKLLQDFRKDTYGRRILKFEEESLWKDLLQDKYAQMTNLFKVYVFCTLQDLNNENPQSTITTLCDVKEIAKSFIEQPLILWYDPNLPTQSYSEKIAEEFDIFEVEEVSIYSNFGELEERISHLERRPPYHLILTGNSESEKILNQLDDMKSLHGLYIYETSHEAGKMKEHDKVKFARTLKDLIPEIKKRVRRDFKRKLNLPTFASDFNFVDRSHVFKLHYYLKGLINFTDRVQAKKDFINLANKVSKVSHQEKIAEFEESYNNYERNQIIKWYTRESPTCWLLNNCLRIASADSILYCRFLLKDLERAVQEQFQLQSKHYNGVAYRAAVCSKEEWEVLGSNTGKEIEMHGFLSTSKQLQIAQNFLEKDQQKKIMIMIFIPPNPLPELDDQGYAEIKYISAFSKEDEILFNVRSRFRILDDWVIDKGSSQECRHLSLLYGPHTLRKYMTQEKEKITVKLDIPNDGMKCGTCGAEKNLFGFNQVMVRYRCIDCLIRNSLPQDIPLLPIDMQNHPQQKEISKIIQGKVLAYKDEEKSKLLFAFSGYKCVDCKMTGKIKYYKWINSDGTNEMKQCSDCFEDKREIKADVLVSESSPFSFWTECQEEWETISSNYQTESTVKRMNEGEVYLDVQDYNRCIEYGNKVLDSLKLQRCKEGEKTRIYDMLGRAYESLGKHEEALEYHLKALELRNFQQKENHLEIAFSYNNLGLVYKSLEEYQKALEYHLKALKIFESVDKTKHSEIATTYNDIAAIYNILGEYEKAQEYNKQAIEKTKSIFGARNPHISASYNTRAVLSNHSGKYQEALDYLQKAIDIRKSIHGENDVIIANSYNNLAFVSESLGKTEEALEYHEKALKIRKFIFGEAHPEVAASYHNLGILCESMKKNKEALEFYKKALEIRKSLFQENHPDIADSYYGLATVFENLGRHEEAWKCQKAAIQIIKNLHGESDLPTGTMYLKQVDLPETEEGKKSSIGFIMQSILIDKDYQNNEF